MRILGAISLAAVLLSVTASTGFAMVSSEQAREANARNATGTPSETAPATANQANPTPYASGHSPGSGASVGPGAGGDTANTPLGYAKGPGENSSVGKAR